MFNVVIGSMYHAAPGMIILFLCIAILACNAQRRSCSRHRYELRFSESTEHSQSQDEVQNEAIYEEIEYSNYRIAEGNSSEMPDCSGRSNSMFSEYDETTRQDTYEDTCSFYQMVDWRNSIVDIDESQSEQYSIDANFDTMTQNCVVESESSFCFQLQRSLSQNEKMQNVCYSDGKTDNKKTYCNDSSDIADHSHIYFTVLPDV